MKSDSLKYIAERFAVVCVFVLFLLMNFHTPMWNDDYAAAFRFDRPDQPISGVMDIVRSIHYIYLNFAGGLVTVFFQHLFAWWGKPYFNLVNCLVFFGLIHSVFHQHIKHGLLNWMVVFALCWLFLPAPGETVFWMIAAIGYLWPSLAALMFCLHYGKVTNKPILLLLSVIIGTMTINMGVITVLFFGIILFWKGIFDRKVDKQVLLIIMGLGVGFLVNFLSPGVAARKAIMYGDVPAEVSLASFITYISTFYWKSAVLVAPAVAVFIWQWRTRQLDIRSEELTQPIAMLIAGLLAPLSMVVSPESAERTSIFSFVFIITATVYFLRNILMLDRIWAQVAKWSLVLVALGNMFTAYATYTVMNSEYQGMVSHIHRAKQAGKKDVKLPRFTVHNDRYTFVYPIRYDTAYIANKHMAAYFGVRSIGLAGDYLKLTLRQPVYCHYCLSSADTKADAGFRSCAALYNRFDGTAVYLALPEIAPPDSLIHIQFGNTVGQHFEVIALEVMQRGTTRILPLEKCVILTDGLDVISASTGHLSIRIQSRRNSMALHL